VTTVGIAWSLAQSMDLGEQLRRGVRYLDLRVAVVDGASPSSAPARDRRGERNEASRATILMHSSSASSPPCRSCTQAPPTADDVCASCLTFVCGAHIDFPHAAPSPAHATTRCYWVCRGPARPLLWDTASCRNADSPLSLLIQRMYVCCGGLEAERIHHSAVMSKSRGRCSPMAG
jgi:hypothetical protein